MIQWDLGAIFIILNLNSVSYDNPVPTKGSVKLHLKERPFFLVLFLYRRNNLCTFQVDVASWHKTVVQ